jgi:two-component system cell cycle response regulator
MVMNAFEADDDSTTDESDVLPLEVLVVEDDPATREMLENAIRFLGYACRSASDGQEAWEVHQGRPADIIVSDWQMPNMDGAELCRRTRSAQQEGAYTYFIFMTAYADKVHFVRGMEAGADDYHTKPVNFVELRARLVSAARVVALYRRLARKNAKLRRDSQTSFRVARVDALTQVANRLSMDEDLKALWARATRYGHRYTIGICDVDRFKGYNDRFGHVAGDGVLRRVAETIRGTLRQGDGFYRYGGEEFVVLLPEQSLKDAAYVFDRLRLAVQHLAISSHDPDHVVTISAGVAELDSERDASPVEWLQRADEALYRAKAAGRNRVEISRPPGATMND